MGPPRMKFLETTSAMGTQTIVSNKIEIIILTISMKSAYGRWDSYVQLLKTRKTIYRALKMYTSACRRVVGKSVGLKCAPSFDYNSVWVMSTSNSYGFGLDVWCFKRQVHRRRVCILFLIRNALKLNFTKYMGKTVYCVYGVWGVVWTGNVGVE